MAGKDGTPIRRDQNALPPTSGLQRTDATQAGWIQRAPGFRVKPISVGLSPESAAVLIRTLEESGTQSQPLPHSGRTITPRRP